MELLGGLVVLFVIVVFLLLVKIHTMQKAMKEMEEALNDRLMTDSNVLIDIASHDKYVRRLASTLNRELRKLRRERQRFFQGDMELKNAVTNISHDLRTPLTAICGYLDLLESQDKSDTVNRYIDVISNRVEMLKQLTEELFRYSVIITSETKEKGEVVINSVLEESIVSFYAALKEKGIEPDIQMPEGQIIRNLDRAALSRVLANLLNNAVKYSDGDLKIELSEAGEITFSNSASNLDEVQVGKLFERFYTVEDAQNSTGLGLAIARTLVEQMGGMIDACYREGELIVTIQNL